MALINGRVVNPETSFDQVTNVLIEGGKIAEIGSPLKSKVSQDCDIIYCTDKIVCPGLIDMHVHFRTPGQEYKETFTTGSMAALAGGFTSIVAMANTFPVTDTAEILHQLLVRAEHEALINYYQVSAATEKITGESVVDFEQMINGGAVAFSDDGQAIQNPDLLIEVMTKCTELGKSFLVHCQDNRFDTYDKQSEFHYVSLVLKIAEQFKVPVHIQHVSCAESVQLIREAKTRGVKVTCETAPHYIALTQKDFKRIGPNAKMNPPLRGEADRQVVIQGLIDGTIDVIATDHAPHSPEEKESLDVVPFGIIGLETAVPVVFAHLNRQMTISEIVAKMTINPARILGLEQKGQIKEGWPADITIIDPKMRKVLEAEDLKSKSQNSPWLGKRLQTWPVMTIRNGKIMMREGEIIVE